MKVLIAEDDSTSAIVLRKALEKLGHDVVLASDGDIAYSLLSRDTSFSFRLVISDWMMPGMDGLELTRRLREERKPGDPFRFVILLTARGRPEDRRLGLDAGADDFMVKPLDMGDLIPRLSIAERMLALEDMAMAAASAPHAGAVSHPALSVAHSATTDPGEAAAAAIVLSSVSAHESSEMYLEPAPGGRNRVRVRLSNGVLRVLPLEESAVASAKQFFIGRFTANRYEPVTLRVGDREFVVAVEILALHEDGERIYVRVVSDSADRGTDSRWEDLPMLSEVRKQADELLTEARRTGGILLVSGKRSDRALVARSLRAIRTYLTNDSTLIIGTDDVASERQLEYSSAAIRNWGAKAEQAMDVEFPRVAEGYALLTEILRHQPDVVIVDDITRYGGLSLRGRSHQLGSNGPLIVAGYLEEVQNLQPHPLGIVGLLSIVPLSADGGNSRDRFRVLAASASKEHGDYFGEENRIDSSSAPYGLPSIEPSEDFA